MPLALPRPVQGATSSCTTHHTGLEPAKVTSKNRAADTDRSKASRYLWVAKVKNISLYVGVATRRRHLEELPIPQLQGASCDSDDLGGRWEDGGASPNYYCGVSTSEFVIGKDPRCLSSGEP